MNSHDEKKLSEQYQQVPRVDSPEHLDKQILEAAHRHAPAERKGLINHWAPALATICVAGVVFYMATPVIDSPTDLRPPAASVSEPAVMSDVAESFDKKFDKTDAVSNQDADPAISKAQRKLAPAQRQIEELDATAARIQKERKKDELSRLIPQEALSVESDLRDGYSADLSVLGANELEQNSGILAETAPLPASQPPTKANARGSVSNVQRKRELPLTVEEITLRIERINELAEQALDDDATRLLEKLIVQCPDCALPEILAELNKTLEGQEQIESKQND